MFDFITGRSKEKISVNTNGSAWVNLDNSVTIPNITANAYSAMSSLSIDGTAPTYIKFDPDLNEFIETEHDPDKKIAFAYKLLYENYCKKYPDEVETWEMQLILNNKDYSITVPYIIQCIQEKTKKGV